MSVIDLGTGNLFSVLRGLERAGGAPELIREATDVAKARRLILPGVGAFADAAARLRELNLAPAIRDAVSRGTPVLGICLGMQMLFESGEEGGNHEGLGLLPGRVTKLKGGPGLAIPHVGWQPLRVRHACELLSDSDSEPWFYFSHSYRAQAQDEHVVASALHGEEIPAVVARGSLFGIQPHPEKSGSVGTAFLQRFLAL